MDPAKPSRNRPDPEQFARAVLWHLAGLRADVADARAEIDMVLEIHRGGPASEAFLRESTARTRATQLRLYRESCLDAGLDPTPPGAAPPDAPEADPQN